jgi:D-alanine-D-alanine ligase
MKTIGIICGGFSSEWEISMKSALTIHDNFPSEYRVFRILLNHDGWFALHNEEKIPLDLNTMTFQLNGEVRLDAAIVFIHGNPGENGKVQAFLDMMNIPCINSGPLASALSFDKWYCNQFLHNFGFKIAQSELLLDLEQMSPEALVESLGLPMFIKPADSGSSYGISKAKLLEDVRPSLEKAFAEGRTVVVESFLSGTEVTCGVYRRKDGVYALPLTEIASENEFFDYEAKYNGKSQEITPARVSDEVRMEVQKQAKRIYELLQLKSIARVDFMVVNNVPHVIEVNTTPGFSSASLVPQMIACDGNTITEFWREIMNVELPQ